MAVTDLPADRVDRVGPATRAREVDKVLAVAAAICAILVLVAVVGPFVAPHPPDRVDLLNPSAGPSGDHLLGTDGLGRDILSRILHGARLSLLGPAIVVAVSTILGAGLAITAAWHGGWWDRTVTSWMDLVFAIPGLLFALLAVSVFGQGMLAPVIALSIAYTPWIGRVIRTVAVRESDLPYVDAGRMAGFSSWRICTRHILPNCVPIIVAQATIAFGSVLVELSAISFLGLGVQAPQSEWGLMVSDGRAALLNGQPEETLYAGMMIVFTVVAFNVLGERLAARTELTR
jgi:peptide/nickel transport system permease protein